MIFWDTSALVPLLVAEPQSPQCAETLAAHGVPVVWGLTSVEIASALHRRLRDGSLTEALGEEALGLLEELTTSWTEVRDLDLVRQRALRLVAVHGLRAGDALQLAAALLACEERPSGHGFVCLDVNLRSAAGREGFVIYP